VIYLKWANLAVAFLLELCALAALAFWGFTVGETTLMKIILGLGAPIIAAVLWGMYAAPKAVRKVSVQVKFAVEVLVFGSAALGLALAGQGTLAIVFVAAVIINKILLLVWKQ